MKFWEKLEIIERIYITGKRKKERKGGDTKMKEREEEKTEGRGRKKRQK